MIVLSLTNCSNALRGDLTRWLFEVDTNLYVGKQSARVRDRIWERVVEQTKSGSAVIVYPTNNEQGFDFRVWGTNWNPIDYDGLKLMLRPHHGNIQTDSNKLVPGKSKIEQRMAAKRFANPKNNAPTLPDTYVVVDVETTGLSVETDTIIEIGSIKVVDRKDSETFQAIVRIGRQIPFQIEKLTGITNEIVLSEGRDLKEVIGDFREFIGELPIVSHNVVFDIGFIRKAYEKCEYPLPINTCIDTLRLARRFLDDPQDYKLETLMKYFGFSKSDHHRGLSDCEATSMLFEKLRIIACGETIGKVNENERDE